MGNGMHGKTVVIVLSLFFFIGITGITGCKEGTPSVRIEAPKAMLSPMLIGVGSVFMKIVNSGGGDDAIISASTNIPGTFRELHDVKEGKMARIENMRVPSKSTVVLKPASLHNYDLQIAERREGRLRIHPPAAL
jgi:hypothetical protein